MKKVYHRHCFLSYNPLIAKPFWPELIEYVDKNEATLLKTCNSKNIKSAVRGWIFEELVIMRFQRHDIETSTALRGLLIPSCKVVEFRTLSGMYNFPALDKEKKVNRIWVPLSANFAAVDVILELKGQIWGIQIHTSTHKDVCPKFAELCENAGWFKSHERCVHLLYLSPSPTIKDRTKKKKLNTKRDGNITVSFASVEDFECLKGIQWADHSAT